MSDVRLTSWLVYRPDTAELHAAREQLVVYSARLLADGLAVGSAGNLSVRCGDLVAITPSGIGYDEMRQADVAVIAMDGTEVDAPEVPSSETPMHLAVYASTSAGAVVHTHSPEVIALSTGRDELPAVHYAITSLGGPVRVAPYVRFGSDGLASAATQALAGGPRSCATTGRSAMAGRSARRTATRCCSSGWPASTGWPSATASRGRCPRPSSTR